MHKQSFMSVKLRISCFYMFKHIFRFFLLHWLTYTGSEIQHIRKRIIVLTTLTIFIVYCKQMHLKIINFIKVGTYTLPILTDKFSSNNSCYVFIASNIFHYFSETNNVPQKTDKKYSTYALSPREIFPINNVERYNTNIFIISSDDACFRNRYIITFRWYTEKL